MLQPAPAPVATPDIDYDVISPLVQRRDVWETEYLQVLTGIDPVKKWIKGTWLKPFLDALDEHASAAFEPDCADHVRTAYPPREGGKPLFPFQRLFIIATRQAGTGNPSSKGARLTGSSMAPSEAR